MKSLQKALRAVVRAEIGKEFRLVDLNIGYISSQNVAALCKYGILQRKRYGVYTRLVEDPMKRYKEAINEIRTKKRRPLGALDKAYAKMVIPKNPDIEIEDRRTNHASVSIAPFGEDGSYLIRIGERHWLATEIVITPLLR